jgi:hypothetical protein
MKIYKTHILNPSYDEINWFLDVINEILGANADVKWSKRYLYNLILNCNKLWQRIMNQKQ